jgi:predicted methyltransferase
MHRIKNTDPMADTQAKIRALGAPRGSVLDTATGLGYTAIEAARTAQRVLTVELDPGAIEIARLNPWSEGLFQSSRIEQRMGDVAAVVRELPAASFEAVLHDPPTMALGGDLYGADFYRELKRVLKRGGRLFHYVGDPDSGLGAKTYPGVMRRLSECGFRNVRRQPDAFGVTAQAS